jgi:transposase-like protein
VTAVARRHDVHPNLLHHWRRQAKRALEGGQGLKFLPVTMTASVRPKVEGSIEIELAGARVRVDAAVDEAALGRVLRALGR